MRKVSCVVAVAAALIAVPAAKAGTVDCATWGGISPEVTFLADPGESNQIAVRLDSEELTFTDHGAPLTATGPCTRVNANEISFGAINVRVDAGDESDTLSSVDASPWPSTYLRLQIDPGPGDDVVQTVGGEHNEVHTGAQPDGADAITLSNSGGWDVVSYADRSGPVHVS